MIPSPFSVFFLCPAGLPFDVSERWTPFPLYIHAFWPFSVPCEIRELVLSITLMSPSSGSQSSSPHAYDAVTPVDIVRGYNYPMAMTSQPGVASENRGSPDGTGASSLKSPRAARFAEATSVRSPVGPTANSASPFADPPSQSESQDDVSAVGFGYVAASDPARHASHSHPPATPLKSALKTPGTPGRGLNPLSPTFREEYYVEKHEKSAEKDNARDLVSELLYWPVLARVLMCPSRESNCESGSLRSSSASSISVAALSWLLCWRPR